MSLREIASATKIPMRTLEALEHNDLARLPGGLFARSFIRSYALQVGIDPESLLEDFTPSRPHTQASAPHSLLAPGEDALAIESERRIAATVLWLILVSVPLAGALVYFGTVGRQTIATRPPVANRGGPAPPTSPLTTPGTIGTARASGRDRTSTDAVAAIATAATAAFRPEAAEAALPRLAIGITATSACRITAIVDGRALADREFAAGEQATFDVGRELLLTVSDPSAIELTMNGGRARLPGPAGEAATTRVTPGTYKEYLAVP